MTPPTAVEEKYPLGLKGRGPTGGRKTGAKGGGGDPWAKGVAWKAGDLKIS